MKKLVKFPEVLFFQEGPGVRNTQYTSEGVKLLNVANLVNGQVDLSTSDRFISIHEAYGKYKHFLCDEGDFIIASSGIKVEYVDKKMGFVDGSMLPLCMNTSTIRFKVLNNKELNIRYFMYYLKSKHFKAQLGKQITGSAQLNYGPSHLKDMTLPMTDIGIQNNIVNILDKIQNIINTYETKLEKLDKLVRARFVELFGDPTLNNKGFPVYKMGEVVDFQGGSQPDKKYFEYEPTENNIRLIQIRDYKTDRFITYIPKKMAKRFCNVDDIMIGRYGPPIFQILQGIEGSFNVALMKAIPKMGNIEFVRWFLKQDCLLRYLEGMSKRTAGQDGIQMDKLKEYPFIMPPIEMQNEFEQLVKQVNKSKFALKLLHSYIMIMM